MKYNNTPSDTGFDWNMNMAFLYQLDKVMTDAHTFRQQNNNYAWFCALRGVYAMIHHKFKEPGQEEQEAKLEQLFKQAQEFMSGASKANAMQIAVYTLDAIDIALRDLVIEYGFVILESGKQTKGNAIREKFKRQ